MSKGNVIPVIPLPRGDFFGAQLHWYVRDWYMKHQDMFISTISRPPSWVAHFSKNVKGRVWRVDLFPHGARSCIAAESRASLNGTDWVCLGWKKLLLLGFCGWHFFGWKLNMLGLTIVDWICGVGLVLWWLFYLGDACTQVFMFLFF